MLFSEPKIPQSSARLADCSNGARFSALQRAENSSMARRWLERVMLDGFSALQRAENSSIIRRFGMVAGLERFQCSSASRKFLNASSRSAYSNNDAVSVLFSEPKIPQSSQRRASSSDSASVSVLFSEPKIPQSFRHVGYANKALSFSALQRAENSSILSVCIGR